MQVAIDANLQVELERDGGEPVHLHLFGKGRTLVLEVDDPGAFAGSDDAPLIRLVAEDLAARGLVLHVVHGDRRLVSMGKVRVPWWQRRLTGSRRIRLGSLRGAWTSARARAAGGESVLPSASLAPPPTLFPLVPTLQRRPRRVVTTTHDPDRGGGARLVLVRTDVWAGERQPVFWLEDGMTFGSAPSCDVVLAGLEPLHATLHHDDRDEWVVVADHGVTRVHGAPVVRQILRTGARVEMGAHQLVFTREEYADHGRPHGGRIGGELGRQLPQPTRDELQARRRQRPAPDDTDPEPA